MACRVPGAEHPAEFWAKLQDRTGPERRRLGASWFQRKGVLPNLDNTQQSGSGTAKDGGRIAEQHV